MSIPKFIKWHGLSKTYTKNYTLLCISTSLKISTYDTPESVSSINQLLDEYQ